MNRHCDTIEERLNDHVDRLLRTEESAEVDRHLETCAACRAARDELLDLREAAQKLPRTLEPPHDLWPRIRASIPSTERPRRPTVVRTPPRAASWRPLLAAAAVVAIAGAAVLLLVRPSGPGAGEIAPVSLGTYADAETEYARATKELLAALEARQGELAPETLAVVDENLRIIDQAIRDVRAALEQDPGDAGAGRQFTSLYARKVALLRQAVRLPAAGLEGGAS